MKIKFLKDCLLIDKILVIGDIHLGYNEDYSGRWLLGRTLIDYVVDKLEGVFRYLEREGVRVERVVLLGDVKHDFGKIKDVEWRDVLKLLDYLNGKVKKIVVIKGNHDNILKPILDKRGIKLKHSYRVGGVCFMHGNKVFKQCLNSVDVQTVVLGHLHPAIVLSDNYKSEKFRCFLRGKWKGKEVYVLPSFSGVSLGYDLLNVSGGENYRRGDDFFIINKNDLKRFEVIIYNYKENKKYNFGKLKKFIE